MLFSFLNRSLYWSYHVEESETEESGVMSQCLCLLWNWLCANKIILLFADNCPWTADNRSSKPIFLKKETLFFVLYFGCIFILKSDILCQILKRNSCCVNTENEFAEGNRMHSFSLWLSSCWFLGWVGGFFCLRIVRRFHNSLLQRLLWNVTLQHSPCKQQGLLKGIHAATLFCSEVPEEEDEDEETLPLTITLGEQIMIEFSFLGRTVPLTAQHAWKYSLLSQYWTVVHCVLLWPRDQLLKGDKVCMVAVTAGPHSCTILGQF